MSTYGVSDTTLSTLLMLSYLILIAIQEGGVVTPFYRCEARGSAKIKK